MIEKNSPLETAEFAPPEDPIARRIGEIADILFRDSAKEFNLRVGEREVRFTHRPRFEVVLDSPRTLRQLLLRPNEYAIGEAFIDGRFDIQGDLFAGLKAKNTLIKRAETLQLQDKLRILIHLLRI